MKRVVIVGGSGFIGTHLASRLLELGHSVKILDKAPSRTHPDLVTIGDVRNAKEVALAVAGADCVVNLAAEHRDDVHPESLYFDVNVGGAKNVVDAALADNVNRIIFISTVALYGLNQPNADESAAVMPFNSYARSKALAEQIYAQWADETPTRSLLTLRSVVVFGEGNRGNVYNLIEQIRRGRLLMIGTGRNFKSMAYVGNLVEFICRHLDGLPGRQLFNYTDPPDKTTAELVALICSLLNKRVPPWRVPYWLGLAVGYACDAFAALLRRPLAISSVRVRKFCANTQVSSTSLEQNGFVRPFTIEEGLAHMIVEIRARATDQKSFPE
jgi:nucleoside-diphosphate-sugar epimerase